MRALARAVPAWVWLTGIVVASTVIRFWLARRVIAPWIMIDELVYSDLARSFAASGHFLVRGQSAGGAYAVGYSLLISPAFRRFQSIPSAYEAAKAINSLLMSLTAIPVYFLARRMLSQRLALVAAAFSLAIPSLAYTSTLMTENAFYPAFCLVALALVLVLERPTTGRQLALLALCALAFLIRAQAVAFLPALLTAPLLLAWLERRPRALREYRVLWGASLAALVLIPLAEVARGKSPLGVFGAYESAGHVHYSLGSVLRWLVYHLAALDLYLGVIPFAAFLTLAAVARHRPRNTQAFIAAAAAISVWLLLEVATFASKNPIPPRVEERNMFYLAPLFVIALLAWIEAGMPRRAPAWVAGAVAAALPAIIPFKTLIGVPASSDELALSIWWRLQDHTIALNHVWVWAFVVSTVAALLFVFVPRNWSVVLPCAVAAVFVAVSWTAMDDVHGFRARSIGELFQGITSPHRDWIDRAVGHHANVAIVFTKCASTQCAEPWSLTDEKVVWQNEFFSRSVGPVYYVHDPIPGGLPESKAVFHRRTGLFTAAGEPIHAQYALVDQTIEPAGRLVAEDSRKGVFLYRLAGPLRQNVLVNGLYADTWSGPRVTYLRRVCAGGWLSVALGSDASLVHTRQTVTATSFGRRLVGTRVPAGGSQMLRVPLVARDGRCVVTLDVTPTKVPGKRDPRRLGIHMTLTYLEPAHA